MLRLCCIFTVIFLILFAGNSFSRTLMVKKQKVYLMSGPGKNFNVNWEYVKGFPLKILTVKGAWIEVVDFEGDTGWVPKYSLENQPAVIVKANKGTQKKINIRTGPGRKFKIIGKALYGVVFEKIGQKKGWTKVHHDSGLVGWIKNTLLWGTD